MVNWIKENMDPADLLVGGILFVIIILALAGLTSAVDTALGGVVGYLSRSQKQLKKDQEITDKLIDSVDKERNKHDKEVANAEKRAKIDVRNLSDDELIAAANEWASKRNRTDK